MATLLTYTIITDPFPLQAGAASATLTLVASNETSVAVSLSWLTIKIPVGPMAQQLTSQATVIGPVPPAGWNNQNPQPTPSPGFFIFGFLPGSSGTASTPPVATIPAGTSILFILNDIQVNNRSGPVEIDITEGSAGSPMQPFSVSKFPAGWGNVDFWVNPPDISAGQPTTLNWSGPAGATYTIEYIQKSVVVNIPAQGQPPLGNAGTYPGQGQPPLILDETTIFTLNVNLSTGSQVYNAQLQKAVTVAQLLPTITSFTGAFAIKDNQPSLLLNWSTDATSCTLSNSAAVLGPNGPLPIAPSAAAPLMVVYTLTASNTAGSANSSLALAWGIKTSIPADAPIEVALSPDESRLYVVNGGSVAMFNRTTLAAIGSAVPFSASPIGLAVSPDGTRLYVTNIAESGGSVTFNVNAFDCSGSQLVLLGGSIPVGQEPMTIVITPDGSKIFAANGDDGTVSVLATSSDPNNPLSLLKTIPLSANAFGLALSPDGTKVYAGSSNGSSVFSGALAVIDTTQLALIGTPVSLGIIPDYPNSIAVTPDGSHVFVGVGQDSLPNAVQAFQTTGDPANPLKAAGKYDLPSGYSFQTVVAAPDNAFIYVVVVDGNLNGVLLMVEIATMQAVGLPMTGLGVLPAALAVSADGTCLYAVSSRDGNIWSLTPASFSGGTAAKPLRRHHS